MSENEKTGKEPFERIKVYQDFCNLTWSEGDCYAGRTNFFPSSELDFSSSFWESGGFTATNNLPGDPTGGNLTILLEAGAGDGHILGSPDIPSGLGAGSDTIYYTLYVKYFEGSTIERCVFFVYLDGGGAASIYIDPGISGAAPSVSPRTNSGSFESYAVEEVGDPDADGHYWAKATISILRETQTNPAEVDIWFITAGGFSPNVGEKVYFYGLSSSNREDEDYVPTFGTSVSAISATPCYNTRATCQVPDVYDRGELELKFCKKQRRLPRGEYHIPSLSSVRITPGSINPGGSDSNVSAMGKRGTISASFEDHTHSDLLVDKYRLERGYDPKERSTFWSKWRARNPYYMHRKMLYESGYILDGQVVDSITRTFFITGFSGPDANGRVSISGKDVLTLAANDKAKAPFASTGSLDADITDSATSITLTPSGIGDIEYPVSADPSKTFWVRIGKEVIEVYRLTGSDTLNVVNRGTYGTAAQEHDETDTVQLCLVYDAAAPADILYDLLNTYAKVPDEFLDKAQWDGEQFDYLPRRYSTIISEPEGITKLVGEMCQQMYFTTWFDERESLVKMRAVRPAENDTIYELDDRSNLVMDSIQWTDKADELITQVWVYHTQINPTEKLDQGDNYAALRVIVDPTSESADRNNLSRIKTIYSRWIDDGAAAQSLGEAILSRYGSAPRECSFTLDAKDRDVWLADFVRLTNRLRVDFDGNPVPANMQVFEAQESKPGSSFSYKAKEYIAPLNDGDVIIDPNQRPLEIDSDRLNVNLRELHDSQYAPPVGGEIVTIKIKAGVTIGGYAAQNGSNIKYAERITTNDFYDGGTGSVSGIAAGQIPILQRRGIGSLRTTASGAAYPDGGGDADFEIREYPISTAFDTGTWPAGVTLNMVLEGGARILGEGGNGSTHGLSGGTPVLDGQAYNAAAGGDGGHGLRVSYPISITNGGIIAGGGAGGGACLAALGGFYEGFVVTPGGGGGGFEISDTSTNKANFALGGFTQRQPSIGSATSGGSGGFVDMDFLTTNPEGGNGGRLAAAGGKATLYAPEGSVASDTTAGLGGTPGDAIAEGADLITWVNKGDVRGAETI